MVKKINKEALMIKELISKGLRMLNFQVTWDQKRKRELLAQT